MKTRYSDVDLDEMVAMMGWNDQTLLCLYANFVAERQPLAEFTDWCRAPARARTPPGPRRRPGLRR